MTDLPQISTLAPALDDIAAATGRVVVFLNEAGQLDQLARRVNKLTKGALQRFAESDDFEKMKEGQCHTLAYPVGLAAKAVDIVRLERGTRGKTARRAGGAIGARAKTDDVLVCAGPFRGLEDVCLGATLRPYTFRAHKTPKDETETATPAFRVMTPKADELEEALGTVRALAEGVYFTRDLVNEPSNVLTTTAFADRLLALQALGVDVEVLDEADLEALGMNTLLAVGQGSESPSKVVIMTWSGGPEGDAPLALVGKGVTFDTGGISIKPANGMEAMTMDMGGAGTVAGVMKALALRNATANVVGLVGLVENMPDGRAMRPGDVVRSLKGDTVEIINTDAEGRLVLADVLWYAADRFKPAAMVDLATLTGAVVVALGHHNAGLFCNDEPLAKALTSAAAREGEGLWRLPLGSSYADQMKSRIADIKNTGSRGGGASSAAEFLHNFVADGVPWAHIDIAGTATTGSDTSLARKGATGYGVLTLNRWIDEASEVEDG